jgi:FKBP-type peptidyl-prolyl cis-trans isomerase FkpA
VIKEAGDGVKPTSSSIVTVAYKGYYTDGEVLMKVVPAELHFLQNVIKGWTEEFPFKEGGSGTLLIPSPGYGSNDSNGLQVAPCSFLMLSSSP